jgi:hypothetical protein
MPDFANLRSVCNKSTAFSKSVIDEFLIPYAAQREQLGREMDDRFGRFRKVAQALQPGWVNLFKAQYIGHRIFKKDGLVKKYLNHTAVKALKPEERGYLDDQSAVPWRFSFSIVTDIPEADFYEMADVFSGETFLLYSPSVAKTLAEGAVSLWFNLIGFNGHCWQSFGPVISFSSFDPDDIFFFATELNPQIETEEELSEDVESNPVPYMMLITGSNYPVTVNGEDEIVQLVGEYPLFNFDGNKLKKTFTIEYARDVYRLKPHKWEGHPHFAAAYYAENENRLLLTALTDRGYEAVVRALISHAFNISLEPDIRLHLPMMICINEILGKELHLNPYEEIFERKSTPVEQGNMDKLNRLLSLALPFINSGQEPDIAALAGEAGVDEETAREVLNHAIGRIRNLQDKAGKSGKGKRPG